MNSAGGEVEAGSINGERGETLQNLIQQQPGMAESVQNDRNRAIMCRRIAQLVDGHAPLQLGLANEIGSI
jgi:histidine ammonia-lyase